MQLALKLILHDYRHILVVSNIQLESLLGHRYITFKVT